MILTIAVPTIKGRERQFRKLMTKLFRQQIPYLNEVELIHLTDNKEISIGEKRNKLYNMARGEYTVMIDDDDDICTGYVGKVIDALITNPDCVGYKELVNWKGSERGSIISLKSKEWSNPKPKNGIWYYRTPFFKVPIKTEICRKVGVKDMRHGEDHDFSKRMFPYLETEYFIDEYMYIYNAPELNTIADRNKRFGIK